MVEIIEPFCPLNEFTDMNKMKHSKINEAMEYISKRIKKNPGHSVESLILDSHVLYNITEEHLHKEIIRRLHNG